MNCSAQLTRNNERFYKELEVGWDDPRLAHVLKSVRPEQHIVKRQPVATDVSAEFGQDVHEGPLTN